MSKHKQKREYRFNFEHKKLLPYLLKSVESDIVQNEDVLETCRRDKTFSLGKWKKSYKSSRGPGSPVSRTAHRKAPHRTNKPHCHRSISSWSRPRLERRCVNQFWDRQECKKYFTFEDLDQCYNDDVLQESSQDNDENSNDDEFVLVLEGSNHVNAASTNK